MQLERASTDWAGRALTQVQIFATQKPRVLKQSFVHEVAQNFTAYFAEVYDANETDLGLLNQSAGKSTSLSGMVTIKF